MPHFQRPAARRRPIGSDDARAAARILTEPEPTAADVARFDQIMADAYGTDPALPGTFTEPAAAHGGRPVLMALGYSYFLSGHGPQDIPKAMEDCGACEGTGRLGPPILMDDPVVPDASEIVTEDLAASGPAVVQDEPFVSDVPPFTVGGRAFEFADNFCGDIPWWELTPAEEARRAELHAAAQEYGRAGYKVIPLYHVEANGDCACHKGARCPSKGKHPRDKGWQESATTDPQWWRPLADGETDPVDWRPAANIGLALEDIFILDEDPDNFGDVTLTELEQRLGGDWDMPETTIVRTGLGGRHFYFLQPEGTQVGNMKLGQGLDIKGPGGLVVAPPSRSNKGPYSHALKHDPVPGPKWLLDMIGEKYKQYRGEPSKISPVVAPAGRLRAYAKAAIARNRAKLASEKGGNRNNCLNDCAFALGQLAPAGITNEDQCREVLYEAAQACGMDFVEDGVRGTFNSGWRAGMRQPFWPDWAEEDPDTEYPLREWSEFGLGDRMVDRFADTLRWAPIANRWMTWQSGRWEMDSKEAGEWLARPVIEAMLTDEEQHYPGESEKEGEKSPRAAFRDWAKGKRNHKSMAGAASVAKANALMRIDLNACDADPMMINLRNGVLNAGTSPFSFHEHDPDQLLTMRGGVAYDPTAACPLWDAFLAQVQTAEDMRQYLYRIWGYSLTADSSEQAVFLNHGGGANGKSVVLDVLSMIIGDYAQVVPIETLLTSKNKQGRIPNDVARMKGKRFLKCSETMEGRRLDEALIKQLTGGEEVVARFMRAEYFEFRMLGKVHLTSNTLVHVSDDDATWRRVHLIPWTVTIPKPEQDKYLAKRLYETEAPGIFNRLLAGLADWRAKKGLLPPPSAVDAVDAYREREDTLGQAIYELFEIDEKHTECGAGCTHKLARSGSFLYEEYRRWAGQDPMTRKAFYAKLEARGFIRGEYNHQAMFPQIQGRTMGGNGYSG